MRARARARARASEREQEREGEQERESRSDARESKSESESESEREQRQSERVQNPFSVTKYKLSFGGSLLLLLFVVGSFCNSTKLKVAEGSRRSARSVPPHL